MGDITDKTISTFTTDVTLTSGSEATLLTSQRSNLALAGAGQVYIKGWCQQAQSTGQTTLTLSIYRGSSTAGTLIGEANAVGVTGTGTGNFEHTICVSEQLRINDSPVYTLTATQNSTAGTGTVLQGSLEVEVIN